MTAFQKLLTLLLGLTVSTSVLPLRAENASPDLKLKSIPFEAERAYEVRYDDAPNGEPELFRFLPDGRFGIMRVDFCGPLNGHWKLEGERFRLDNPKINGWKAEGTFLAESIEGIDHPSDHARSLGYHRVRKFSGRRIDYEKYEFPLRKDEVIVLVKLKQYVFAERFDDLEEDHVSAFIFEILAPKELKGKLVRSHHDGDLASGPAKKMAVPGKAYLWRTYPGLLSDRPPGACSIVLWDMKQADDHSPDPRYRPGLQLLDALKPAEAKKDGEAGLDKPD